MGVRAATIPDALPYGHHVLKHLHRSPRSPGPFHVPLENATENGGNSAAPPRGSPDTGLAHAVTAPVAETSRARCLVTTGHVEDPSYACKGREQSADPAYGENSPYAILVRERCATLSAAAQNAIGGTR